MRYSLVAHPGSKRNIVIRDKNPLGEEVYHVYTRAKPIDGEANGIIIELMAEYLSYKKYQMKLISGHKNKHKIIEKIDYI